MTTNRVKEQERIAASALPSERGLERRRPQRRQRKNDVDPNRFFKYLICVGCVLTAKIISGSLHTTCDDERVKNRLAATTTRGIAGTGTMRYERFEIL